MPNKQYKDLTSAVTLIAAGIVFLLNTTGIVSWEIWGYILRFWPFILILIGIRFLIPDNKVGGITITTLYFLALVYVILSAYFYSTGQTIPFFSNVLNNCMFNGCNIN